MEDIFSEKQELAKPVKMYPLAMKRYRVGSYKSLELLDSLLKYGESEVFRSKAV